MTTHVRDKANAATAPEIFSDRLIYALLMATIIAIGWLLFTQIHQFSASLDVLVSKEPSESFITISRIGASLVILLMLKEMVVALRAFGTLVEPVAPTAPFDRASAPLVSVIVPAFNEVASIETTLDSLASLDYPRLEIVVVDDGSHDGTLAAARRFADAETRVPITVLTQRNSGKWKALNEGIAASKGELILCVDADSAINRDALLHMVPHFADPSVGAVSGQVQVRNQVNLLTRLQALEYLVANGSARTAQSSNGCVLIVPGPIGLFRRSTLSEVSQTFFAEGGGRGTSSGAGPFSPHTFAEDFELSVMICALGGKIVYEPHAKSLTRAPELIGTLLNQRYRWLRGSMQVGDRYRSGQWDKLSSSRPMRWWMALVTIGDLYIVPLAGLLLLATIVWTLIIGDLRNVLLLWALVWAIHMCAAAMFIRSHGERMSLCLLSPVQTLYGTVLLTGVWTHAVIDHVTGRAMKW